MPESASELAHDLELAVRQFADRQVAPRLTALEAGRTNGFAPMLDVFHKAGEAGLLSAELPEVYGGSDLSLRDVAVMMDAFGEHATASVNVTLFGHTGIGTLPLLLFGTDEQKARFLPKFATGELCAAFALTEPDAGSYTSGMRMTAKLSEDGTHYVLNGSKCFISNGGFADVITVFAKVNGRVTAFLVETRDLEGFRAVEEHDKLGLHGSSTAQLFFEEVKIPVANRLGVEGQGDEILRRTLYRGRYNLAIMGAGEGRHALNRALAYALERRQFNTEIIHFGAVKDLLATVALAVFGIESVAYRLAGDFDDLLAATGSRDPQRMADVWGALSVEASIAKVYGSEQLGEALRKALKVFGGYGFLEEFGIARPLRDQVVSEIYDGTNQIQRVHLIGQQMLRLLDKGKIDDRPPRATGLRPRLGDLSVAVRHAELAKEIALHSLVELGRERHKHLRQDNDLGQMALSVFADLVIQAYAADTVVRRAQRIEAEHVKNKWLHILLAETLAAEATQSMLDGLEELLPLLHERPMTRFPMIDRFRRKRPLVNVKKKRVEIAERLAAVGSYRLV